MLKIEMMKANELMIGDWVSYIGKDFNDFADKISGIIDGCVTLDKEMIHRSIDKIHPIPLTAEILGKNGFVKSEEVSDTPPYDRDEEGNMYYSFKGEHKFWGWWQPNNIFFIPVNAMGNIEIKYVHELQRALRLCNIDKNIEL